MVKNKILYIVVVVLVIGGGLFFFLSNKGEQKENEINQQASVDDKTMVDCGLATDPGCFMNRMNGCLPVTAKMTGSDNKTAIEITILGVENEACHFQRKINNIIDLDCFFPKGTMNGDTLGQIFGDDKGLQKVVDDACKKGW
jgi:hypothetical protein